MTKEALIPVTTPAAAPTRTQGWRKAPRDAHMNSESPWSRAAHFGGPTAGRGWRWRSARSPPAARRWRLWPPKSRWLDWWRGSGGRPAVTNNVIAITRTRQAIQPAMNAKPFCGPRRLARTRMKGAMIGSGPSVTASPRRARSATVTWPRTLRPGGRVERDSVRENGHRLRGNPTKTTVPGFGFNLLGLRSNKERELPWSHTRIRC